MAEAQSQTTLRKHAESPQPLERDDEGKIIYPRSDEGTAGDVYTYDESKRGDLPPETNNLQVPNSNKNETDLMAAAVVTGAMMRGARGNNATSVNLPPNVQANKTEFGTAYTFVASPEARSVGFEPSVLLGVDDGSGTTLGAITEKAWALAAEMDSRVKQAAAEAVRENPTVPTNETTGPSNNLPPMPEAWAMESRPADDQVALAEMQRYSDMGYMRHQDATTHEAMRVDDQLEGDNDPQANNPVAVGATAIPLAATGTDEERRERNEALRQRAEIEGRSEANTPEEPESPAPK